MSKGYSYFELLGALKESGCPICKFVIRDSRSYLEQVFYELVLDVPTRIELIDSFGFCSWHAWQVPSLPFICSPDVGFSIFASDLLRKFTLLAEPLAKGNRKGGIFDSLLGKSSRGLLSRQIKAKACPACRHTEQFESYHLRELIDSFAEEEFVQAYRTSDGLCLPHFFLLEKKYSRHPNFPNVLQSVNRKAQALRDTLEEFIAKQNYRLRDGITPGEAKAWKVAIEFLSGKPGIFPSEARVERQKRARGEAKSEGQVSPGPMVVARLRGGAGIDAIRTAKEIVLYLKQSVPAELLRELKGLNSRQDRPGIEVVVEDFQDVNVLRGVYDLGCVLFYGLGVPSQPLVFLDRTRGFLVEERRLGRGLSLRPLKNAEDLYLSLLWRRFGAAVLLSGSVTENDASSRLFCLTVQGRRQQWCRLRGLEASELPEIGANVELFAWEKWSTHILEVLELKVLEAGRQITR